MALLLLLSSIATSLSLCRCDPDTSQMKFFPSLSQPIAGVFQVSYVNSWNQAYYGLNATEARKLCISLGVDIASLSQVQKALTRGLETCRFGWTDEHLPVVPRRTAQSTCGNNNVGLVKWRTPLSRMFDVFCFNESAADTAAQLEPSTTPLPVPTTATSPLPVSSTQADTEAERALIVGSAQESSRKKTVIITSVVAVFLVALATVIYIKVKRNSDKEPYIESEDWTQVKYTDPKKTSST